MPYNATFDANQFEPKQSMGGHPVGNGFPFKIAHTEVKSTTSGDGGLFQVTFQTPAGQIISRYNLFNKSAKAVEIAHGQFSALCRAVGRYQVDFNNDGAILRGAEGKLDVGYQKGEEPTSERPEGGYVEVKKVYDIHGIEPGKTNAAASQQQPQQGFQQPPQTSQPQPGNQPMVQQAGGGWTNAQPQPQTNQQAPQGWQQPQGNPAPQNQPAPAQQQQPQSGQTWQPGNPAGNGTPPWGNRT